MNDGGIFAKRIRISGNTVIEANTGRQYHIRFIGSKVRSRRTVHPQHTEEEFVLSRERSQAQQCIRHRNPHPFSQFQKLRGSPTFQNTGTGNDKRTFRSFKNFGRFFDLLRMTFVIGFITFELKRFLIESVKFFTRYFRQLYIFRNIHKYRSRSPRRSDVIGFA